MKASAAALVFALPLLVHAPQLVDILKGDPGLFYSGLSANVDGGLLQGSFTADPNIGFIDDASAVRGITDLVHGQLPWWNPYEGVGVPLAGEMQTSPFFPLMALLFLPHGVVWLQAFVQAFAGLFAFLLFDELGLGIAAATVGAIVFAFNGTFAWLSGVWNYPLPALPLLLLGIERSSSELERRATEGIVLIAIAIALAISAGFIETAYLDCLLAVAWALVRLGTTRPERRLRYALRMVAGAAIGIAIAMPILVAFGDYLRYAIVGMHDGSAGGGALPAVGMLQIAFPYILGPIFRFETFANILWAAVGGYGGIATSVLALSALAGRSNRPLRILLAAWIVFCIGATFGVPLCARLFDAIPGVKYIALYRYIDASWEFAVATLIAFALGDLRSLAARIFLRRTLAASAAVFAFGLYALAVNAAFLDAQTTNADFTLWATRSLCIGAVLLVALPTVARFVRPSQRVLAIGVLVCAESIGYYTIPMLALPRSGHLELGSVRYLQAHLGLDRFYTLGPLSPNYGSRYGIASINHNDLPVPEAWFERIRDRLDPAASPLTFTGTNPGGASARSATFEQNRAEFQNVGVRYVVTSPGSQLAGGLVDVAHAATGTTAYELRNGDRLRYNFSLAPGHLEQLAVLVSSDHASADGTLSMRLCDVGGCHDGEPSSLRGSAENAYLPIAFTGEPLFLGGSASLELRYAGGAHPVKLFAFDAAPNAEDRVVAGGRANARKTLGIRLAYASTSVSGALTFASARAASSARAAIRGQAPDGLDYGTVDAIALQFDRRVGESKTPVALRLCDGNACRRGASRLARSGAGAIFRVKLDAPIFLGAVPPTVEIGPLAAGLRQSLAGSTAQATYDNIGAPRVRAVYRDAVSEVYRLPTAAPYFSAPHCRLSDITRTSLRAECDAASRLERLELYMPGWQATVNDAGAAVTAEDQTFQGIDLPPGSSRIAFAFTPEYENFGFTACAAGVATLLVLWYRLADFGRRTSKEQA